MTTQARAESLDRSSNNAAVLRAKLNAALGTLRLAILVHGTIALIVSLGLTMVLTAAMHTNFLMTLAGSFVGFAILCGALLPMKALWKSKLFEAYQREHLYDLANAVAVEDIAKQIDEILAGKSPSVEIPNHDLRIAGVKLMFIRQGQLRKAWKIGRYVHRLQPDNLLESAAQASLETGLGYFDEAIDLCLRNVDNVTAENRAAENITYIALSVAYIDLHQTANAKKWLDKLSAKIGECEKTAGTSKVDNLVRSENNANEFDTAFHLLYLAKYQMLLGMHRDAHASLLKAEKIASKESNQKRLQLFYPDVLTAFGELALLENDTKTALKKFIVALELLEKTQYRGSDYHLNRALIAYTKWKVEGKNPIDQIESALRYFDGELQPDHPKVGPILVALGEAQAQFDVQKAKANYERALAIYKKRYPADDKAIPDVEARLAALESA